MPDDDTVPTVTEYTDESGNTWQLSDEDAEARGLKKATTTAKAVAAGDVQNKNVTPRK